jgi:uncharacterized protein YkwD
LIEDLDYNWVMKTRKRVEWIILLVEVVIIIGIYKNLDKIRNTINIPITPIVENISQKIETQPTPTMVIKKIIVTPTTIIQKKIKPTPTIDNEPWGVAKQINEVTWTMKVGEDVNMATPKEIFDALNIYRQRHGSQVLNWDQKLADYSQTRAKYLNGIKNVDKHEGFTDFVENQDGFNKLGFNSLGENISYGYKLNGVHVIEWMYAGDKPHNDNQLDNRWNYVGIGVDGLATCLIFGTGKF